MGQQKFHQLDVAGLGRPEERRRAVLIEPLVRKDRPHFGAVLYAGIDIGALVEKQLDEIQMVHITLADRIIPGLDIAVIGREIERCPSACVDEVRIGTMLEQVCSEFVVPILCRDKQRAPSVTTELIHVRPGGQQNPDRLEVVRGGGIDQRSQRASILRNRASAGSCCYGVLVIGGRRSFVDVRCRRALALRSTRLALNGTGLTRRSASLANLAKLRQIQCLSGGERRALRRDLSPRIVRLAKGGSSSTCSRIRACVDIRSMLNQEVNGGRM